MKTLVDINTLERKEVYERYMNFENPYFNLTTIIDVTNIVNYSKDNKVSFYALMLYVLLKSVNKLDEYKYVYEDKKLYKYDKIDAGFTVINENNLVRFSDELIYDEKLDSFINDYNKLKSAAVNRAELTGIQNGNNKIYVTCLPWIRITGVTHPINYSAKSSIPLICYGKYFLKNNKYYVDLSVQLNHALQDGYHAAMLFKTIEDEILKI